MRGRREREEIERGDRERKVIGDWANRQSEVQQLGIPNISPMADA
jgi:hypothetical protein